MKRTVTNPNLVEIFGFTINGLWLSPMAIFFSAIVAGIAIYFQRDIASKRATLDVITKTESEEHFNEAYKTFLKVRLEKTWNDLLKESRTLDEQYLKNKLDDFLNHYEFVAISIKYKILDEEIYKSWMKSCYINHFKDSFYYIDSVRNHPSEPHTGAYLEYQYLVEKWEGNNYKSKYKPGEEPKPNSKSESKETGTEA